MALHFYTSEYDARREKLQHRLDARGLDALLVFAQESMYWLTGYDTFGYCFFQCLVVTADGRIVLLTRAPDLRQAKHTSTISDIRIWVDRKGSSPAAQLRELLADLGLTGRRLGVEYDTHGLTAANGRALDEALDGFARCEDGSDIVPPLRLVKSAAEIAYVRSAAELTDAAWDAACGLIAPGADESEILAAMQGAIFRGGGDYPGNEFIIGSAEDALLCRYKAGRRRLAANDQITLEFAGAYRHYHAALMRTVIVG
ncbi:MAG: aminopeptidase P family protein, partial [Hyphomicrobiales bacterium]|nr:aminopeptidase P family protein [Hyphomicrobiales bacterium]